MPAPKDPAKYNVYCKNISKANLGKHPSEESLEKMRRAQGGKNNPMFGKHHTGISKKKIGLSSKGKPRPLSVCKKTSESNKGRKGPMLGKHFTPEHCEKIRVANLGRKHSVETIKKLKEARNKRPSASKITRQKMSDARRGEKHPLFGKPRSKETKLKLSKYTGEKASGWRGGTSFLPYCFKFNRKRKIATRNFFGYLCICCNKHADENISKTMQWRELSVHHVDHDKEQGCNGKPFNLVPMCMECHAKELNNEKEYKEYINKTLEEGFEWGIWSKEQYEIEVMYPEETDPLKTKSNAIKNNTVKIFSLAEAK